MLKLPRFTVCPFQSGPPTLPPLYPFSYERTKRQLPPIRRPRSTANIHLLLLLPLLADNISCSPTFTQKKKNLPSADHDYQEGKEVNAIPCVLSQNSIATEPKRPERQHTPSQSSSNTKGEEQNSNDDADEGRKNG